MFATIIFACDPFSFTTFTVENSLDEDLTIGIQYSPTAPDQGDTTFVLRAGENLLLLQFEERTNQATLGFEELEQLFSSMVAIKSNGDSSVMLNNESEWTMTTQGSDNYFLLRIDEADFQ